MTIAQNIACCVSQTGPVNVTLTYVPADGFWEGSLSMSTGACIGLTYFFCLRPNVGLHCFIIAGSCISQAAANNPVSNPGRQIDAGFSCSPLSLNGTIAPFGDCTVCFGVTIAFHIH